MKYCGQSLSLGYLSDSGPDGSDKKGAGGDHRTDANTTALHSALHVALHCTALHSVIHCTAMYCNALYITGQGLQCSARV